MSSRGPVSFALGWSCLVAGLVPALRDVTRYCGTDLFGRPLVATPGEHWAAVLLGLGLVALTSGGTAWDS